MVRRVVTSLARHLDLNSLHNLSRTCRQFRATLLQYRDQLVTRTLQCEKEDEEPGELDRATIRRAHLSASVGGPTYSRMTTGKIGACARDMVAECRSCGTIVCRVRFADSQDTVTN